MHKAYNSEWFTVDAAMKKYILLASVLIMVLALSSCKKAPIEDYKVSESLSTTTENQLKTTEAVSLEKTITTENVEQRDDSWDGFLYPEKPSAEKDDFTLWWGSKKIYMDMPFSEFKGYVNNFPSEELSEFSAWRKDEDEFKHFYMISYRFEGYSLGFGNFDYDIMNRNPDDRYLATIVIESDDFVTTREVKIGDSRDKVLEKYGMSYTLEDGTSVESPNYYYNQKWMVVFDFKDDKLAKMIFNGVPTDVHYVG